MHFNSLSNFEKLFEEKISSVLGTLDPAHDILHVKRVVKTAKELAEKENAKLEVVLPAAWLHDIVNLPKNHPERSKASQLAADVAISFLKSINYPSEYYSEISHAIITHSFSAGITPETIEAKVVQDADRLDGLGAIGIARLFTVSARMNRPFYFENDPFAVTRNYDDSTNCIDHIEIKLRKVVGLMNTEAAKVEARRRMDVVDQYLKDLRAEII